MIEAKTQPPESGSADTHARAIPQSVAPLLQKAPRDRIVILGRRQAGKTVYLATLYAKLWQAKHEPFVRALDGRTHEECMAVFEAMRRDSEWPPATQGSRYFDLEVTNHGRSRPLVSLDYPGEVFRKAFVTGERTSDVEELLEHVDRAAGVIALVDPIVLAKGETEQKVDDEYGLVRALERIRGRPEGQRVPIALVLTKYDVRHQLVSVEGGPEEFVEKTMRSLLRSVSHVRIFTCTAVQQDRTDDGVRIRSDFRPRGVVAPLIHILDQIEIEESRNAAAQRREQAIRSDRAKRRKRQKERHRQILLWTMFWMTFVVLAIGAGTLTWWMSNQ